MAQHDLVRVLVPNEMTEELSDALRSVEGAEIASVTISAPDPATYRGEGADRRLRELMLYGRKRLVVGAIIGAIVGVGLAFLLDWEYVVYGIPLFAFGGAWGGAVTGTARAIQVAKEDEPNSLPDDTVQVEPDDVPDLRVMTILVPHGRAAVDDFLAERADVQLLDSWRPKVGENPEPPT